MPHCTVNLGMPMTVTQENDCVKSALTVYENVRAIP